MSKTGTILGTALPSIASRVGAYLQMIASQCKGCPRKGSYCAHCMAEPAAGLLRDLRQPAAVSFERALEQTPEEIIAAAREQIRAARAEQKTRRRIRRMAGAEGYRYTKRANLSGERASILRQIAERPRGRRDLAATTSKPMTTYLLKSMASAGLISADGKSRGRRYAITETGKAFLASTSETKTEDPSNEHDNEK